MAETKTKPKPNTIELSPAVRNFFENRGTVAHAAQNLTLGAMCWNISRGYPGEQPKGGFAYAVMSAVADGNPKHFDQFSVIDKSPDTNTKLPKRCLPGGMTTTELTQLCVEARGK